MSFDDHTFTCDDVLNSSILPFVHVPVVFSLPPSELSNQFLLLPFSSVRWRLRKEQIEKDFPVGTQGCGSEFHFSFKKNHLLVQINQTSLIMRNDGVIQQLAELLETKAAVMTWQRSRVGISPWCPLPAAPPAPFSQVTSAPDAASVHSPPLPAEVKKTVGADNSHSRCEVFRHRLPSNGRSFPH